MRRVLARLTGLLLCLSLMSCAATQRNPRTAKRTAKRADTGAVTGTAPGTATGAATAGVDGSGKGGAKGTAVATPVGLTGRGVISTYLDRQAEEVEQIVDRQDVLERRQDSLALSISSDRMFHSGSAQLYPGGRDKLREFAGILNRYPRSVVQIVGHTDDRGTDESNLELSRQRAKAAADELMTHGVHLRRLSVRGVGEASPVNNNATPEGRMQNRRVEITVKPDEGLQREERDRSGAPPRGAYEEPH